MILDTSAMVAALTNGATTAPRPYPFNSALMAFDATTLPVAL